MEGPEHVLRGEMTLSEEQHEVIALDKRYVQCVRLYDIYSMSGTKTCTEQMPSVLHNTVR